MFKKSCTSSANVTIFDKKKWLFLVILTLMSTAGLVGSDVYLPTLPIMGEFFGKNTHAMQLTLGIYLFGLSIGQIIFGPLTDCYGRKKLIIIGMALYFLASLSCAFSLSYTQMLISRFLQALGACSGLVIGRAIVGDIFEASGAGKIFSSIFPFVGMSPAISPVIGGFIGYYFGWESTFIFVAFFAISVAFLVTIYLPETLSYTNRQELKFRKIVLGYSQLLMNKKFIAYVSAPCCAYIAYFAYISQSPFIFHAHGFSEKAIGTFYISLSLTYVAGNLTGKKLLNSFSLNKTLGIGYVLFGIGGLLLFVTGLLNFPLFMMVSAISILTFGNGFLIPLGTAGVISSFSKTAGYASGLLGFLQLGLASLSSSLIGNLSHNTIYGLGVYIFIVTLIAIFLFFYFIWRSQEKQYIL
jgi:DHA1 family bicyclomycin/chloramphenicol resistance-like MFS transporter